MPETRPKAKLLLVRVGSHRSRLAFTVDRGAELKRRIGIRAHRTIGRRARTKATQRWTPNSSGGSERPMPGRSAAWVLPIRRPPERKKEEELSMLLLVTRSGPAPWRFAVRAAATMTTTCSGYESEDEAGLMRTASKTGRPRKCLRVMWTRTPCTRGRPTRRSGSRSSPARPTPSPFPLPPRRSARPDGRAGK
jgi:hypothetical protein